MILSAEIVLPISKPLIFDGAVLIENGKIIELGPLDNIKSKYRGHECITFENAVLLPGLINLHTHLELTAINKIILKDKADFIGWILALVELKKGVSKSEINNGIKNGIKEITATGTTTIADITTRNTFSPVSACGESFNAIKNAGLRGTVFLEVINFDHSSADDYWNDTTKIIEMLRKNETDLLSVGIAPHSIYSVSSKLLKIARDYAIKEKMKMSMHVAESMEEKEFVSKNKGSIRDIYHKKFKWDGKRDFKRYLSSIKYIDKNGLLNKDMLTVHCVNLNEEDIRLLKERNTSVVHCPRSNTFIGVGVAPFDRLISNGINVGIGTDSYASNYSLSMWDEMRFAYLLHRKTNNSDIKAEDIIKCGTINGAKALGINNKIGTLDVGKDADLIAVRLHKKDIDIYRDLLLNTKSDDILMTMVAGKIIYSSGIEGLKSVN